MVSKEEPQDKQGGRGESVFSAELGLRLREERELLGLNQTEFGQLGGVAKVAQLNYEKGYRVPGAEYLNRLAMGGVDVGYVLSGLRGRRVDLPSVDGKLLAAAIKAVTEVSAARGYPLSEEERGITAASLYDLLVAGNDAGQATNQIAEIMLAGWFAARRSGG